MSKLYIISPPQIELEKFKPKLEAAFKKYKPAAFQLRLKPSERHPALVAGSGSGGTQTGSRDIPAMTEILAAAKALQPICKKHGVTFIINDNPQIALDANADGVHMGDEDMAISRARSLLGKDKIIGASCYNSLELARDAVANGASYVSFGAFYPTKTKQAKARAEIATLEAWKKESKVPVSVIGGIDFENKKPLEDAGADYICMISAIWT